MRNWRLALCVFGFAAGCAWAQTGPFNPNSATSVSNQGWNAVVITAGTPYPLSRAIYNGNSAVCNITVALNGGATVQFQNVQIGEILPIQSSQVTSTTCSANTLIAIQ